jgi:hypothetical protein
MGRRGRIVELRMGRLERRQFTHERVELRIGNLRRVVDEIALFVVANQAAELADAFTGGGHEKRS